MTPGPRHVVAVAAGGAVGATARYAALQAQPDGAAFPWTTFAINVVGSALLAGLLLLPLARRSSVVAAGLGPGVLGGFTTFSATSEQARAMLSDGRAGPAGAYVLGTLAAALVAVVVVGALAPPLPAEDER